MEVPHLLKVELRYNVTISLLAIYLKEMKTVFFNCDSHLQCIHLSKHYGVHIELAQSYVVIFQRVEEEV